MAMTTAQQPRPDVDGDAIFDWRFEELQRAGFSLREAWLLAGSKQVDVRTAERLLTQGCPSATALRILL